MQTWHIGQTGKPVSFKLEKRAPMCRKGKTFLENAIRDIEAPEHCEISSGRKIVSVASFLNLKASFA